MASLGPSSQSMRARNTQGAGSAVYDERRSAYPTRSSSNNANADLSLSRAKGGKHGVSTAPSPSATSLVTLAELQVLVPVIFVALIVRFWKIAQPSSVVFDEVHFGGFAGKYVHQKFFMDVHPPLAKLMIAGTAKLFGYDGDFDFKNIGKEYLVGEHTPVPYVAVRTMCALLGVLTIPLAYLTLRALSLRATTALVGALLVTFDNALTTQSRLILLDSPLLFFTSLSTYCWATFCNEEKRAAFSRSWWTWLSLTGIALGAVASCKWVGLFTISTIGVCVVVQLWTHLGDVRLPMRIIVRHFVARAICLIGLPITVYMACFAVHFGVLNRSGEGDGFMSSEFQHTLRGHGMPNTYADVALGSTVTIRHRNTQGGYLHSHAHNYPTGSLQQQITLYPHADENNQWHIVLAPSANDPAPPTDSEGVPLPTDGPHELDRYKNAPVQFLRSGMIIRLIHKRTDKRLHSHDSNRPPVTESDYQNEVTGYGFPGFVGDNNDNFQVEIDSGDRSDKHSSTRVRALRTTFRLRHTLTGCYLFSHKVTLPDWGFGQQEVTCNKNPTRPNSLWYIETNTHPQIGKPDADFEPDMVNYRRPGFFEKFWELQHVMWTTNAGLTDRHVYDSRPGSWPVLRRGINFWNRDHRQIYLIGNPLVWWGATGAVLAYLGARAFLMLRAKRGKKDFYDSTVVFYDQTCAFLTLGWAMHYLPFHAMHRQLFIHHYLPALYFSILLLAVLFDFFTSSLRPRFRLVAVGVVALVLIGSFAKFAPLSYASEWTSGACESSRWLKTWDFDCKGFPESRSAYVESNYPNPIVTVLPTNTTDGTAETSKAEAMAGLAEPGRHAFENGPVKAAQSLGPDAHGNQVFKGEGAAQAIAADKADKEAAHAHAAGSDATPAAHDEEEDPDAVHIEGLDHEQVEAAVLVGTAAASLAGKEAPADAKSNLAPSPEVKETKVEEKKAEEGGIQKDE